MANQNPYDLLAEDLTPEERRALEGQPMPGFMERFRANRDQAYYTGTIAGATKGQTVEQLQRDQTVAAYEAMPQWETPLDALAALGGQLVGSASSPEALLGDIGLGAKVAGQAGIKSASWMARMFSGAVDAGVVNAATDVAVQGVEMGGGDRKSFDPTQTAVATGLGAVIGGGVAAVAPTAKVDAAVEGLQGGAVAPDAATVADVAQVVAPDAAAAAAVDRAANVAAENEFNAELWQYTQGQMARLEDVKRQIAEQGQSEALANELAALNDNIVEQFRVLGLPGDSVGRRAQPVNSIADIERAFGSASKEELQRYTSWTKKSVSGQEPPTLGEVLDGQAREVRGLPKREAAMVAEGNQPPSLSSKTENPEISTPKAAKGNQSLPDELAALSQGPRLGMLGRDQAGTAAKVADMVEPPQFTRLKQVADQLATSLEAVAVRTGRITTAKADGIYKMKSGVIRLRRADDFDVLTHELGHHVEQHLGPDVKTLMKAHAAELEPMAYAGADPRVTLEEGFAEYMRTMVTNPAYARQKAPVFDTAFRQMLAGKHGEVGQALDAAAAAWKGWLEQPSTQAVASTIVSTKEPWIAPKLRKSLEKYKLGGTIAEYLHRFYTLTFDDLHPIARANSALLRIYKANKGKLLDQKFDSNAYKISRSARGAYAAATQDIMHGVRDYGAGTVASSSLRDALVTALGKPNVLGRWDGARQKQFSSYLWSRRALGEWARFEQGLIPNPPDKLTKGDHAQNVKDLEAQFPAFIDAAPMVHDFAQALWTKKFEGGLITREQYDEGLAIVDYVPGLRMFDYSGDTRGGSGKGGADKAKGGFVKRFQGSTRDVIDPLESLMKDAYETNNALARNDSIRALKRLADMAGPGGGAIAELIPPHQMKGFKVDVLEAMQNLAREEGLSDADYMTVRDVLENALGDEALTTIYRPAVTSEKGEPILFFRENGEIRALRLADGQFGKDMMTAFTGMSRMERQAFDILALPLAKAASLSRLGVVADIPFVIKNFVRDQVTAAIYYGRVDKNIVGTARGMAQEVLGRDFARAYNAYGGIMGGANAASVRDMRVRNDLNALARKGWAAKRFTSFEGFLQATELSETGMRFNLTKRFYDEGRGRGLSDHEAMLEAVYQARDYMDFDRRGWMMSPLARTIPFLNANLQGLDKFARQMVVPLFSESLTQADVAARGNAMKAWARVSVVAVGTMAMHAVMKDNKEYDELSADTKARNWVFPVGNGDYALVPKPFEPAAFINLGPALYDLMAAKDPRWADSFVESVRAAFLPPDILLGNPVVKTGAEWYTGSDLRTGSDIIPQDKAALEPFQQYHNRTSGFSIALGEAMNKPPVWIDQMITNFTTSLGRTALSLSDLATSDKPIRGWDDQVIIKSFIKDASRGASSTKAFWELMAQQNGTIEGARRSWEAMQDAGDLKQAEDYLAQQEPHVQQWIALGAAKAEVRRLHPLQRAKNAVDAISDLRRDMVKAEIETGEAVVDVPRRVRGAADDILGKLAMAEARNALVMVGVPGWDNREVMETAGWYRELEAVSPDLAKALADRFATKKVLPLDVVERAWPDLSKALKEDGSNFEQAGFAARSKAAGYEMDGKAMKRRPRFKVE